MKTITIDYKNVLKEIDKKEILDYEGKVRDALNTLLTKRGLGSDFTGWVNLPFEIQEGTLEEIKALSKEIRSNNQCLVVIGIGGSYLGAKAAIDMLSKYYSNSSFNVIFLGNNLSQSYIAETLEYLKKVDFAVNVISKSGKTLEPAVSFRMIKRLLEDKYGKDYNSRVIVTTSKGNSLLHNMAVEEKYHEFYIPDSVGGRYSVLTPVGLLPIACAGFNIEEIIKGAISSNQDFLTLPYIDNPCLLYAAVRNILYQKGKTNEIFVSYEPKLKYLGEWWKQLYGESEGKDNKGIFPVSLTYSTDLHSVGQYVQEGLRNLFETVVDIQEEKSKCEVIKTDDNLDGLNYLAGKPIKFIKDQALKGTVDAHVNGGVPNIIINVKDISEFSFGYLVYFFMLACGVSGYLLGVNPFNQEGVEAYKKNMFALLKK